MPIRKWHEQRQRLEGHGLPRNGLAQASGRVHNQIHGPPKLNGKLGGYTPFQEEVHSFHYSLEGEMKGPCDSVSWLGGRESRGEQRGRSYISEGAQLAEG